MRKTIKAGFIQTDPLFGQVKKNVNTAVGEIEALGAELVVLPELFSTGYQFCSKSEAISLAEEVPDGPTTKALLEVSASSGTIIVAGILERAGEKLFNSAVLISPGGFVALYRKAHLFWREKNIFTPGDTPFEVFDVGGVKLAMMICFDWYFPEVARTLSLKGAEVICHPSNLVLPHCPAAMITRCLENRVYAITANRAGVERRRKGEPLQFIGQSQVVSPAGEVLYRAPAKGSDSVALEIIPSKARNKAPTRQNDIFKDRREDLYRL
ncbi:MAG: nitrilase-related carbon-nitrogen hydrolase [Thermodesulfobacteriota bacterium]